MYTILAKLIDLLDKETFLNANVIPWSAPVPSFGDISRSSVATLGLNPSNREFVDELGNELQGVSRRFHTLKSLGIKSWSEADVRHLNMIIDSCATYFVGNPYDRWFRVLDKVISGTKSSYYSSSYTACHLDLIPYATFCKWIDLSSKQKSDLLSISGDVLALLLRESAVNVLILNGKMVVEQFQEIASIYLEEQIMPSWSLPRRSARDVTGFAYSGIIDNLSGVPLGREIMVLGYNHNLQSSFGVTNEVISSIGAWISQISRDMNNE